LNVSGRPVPREWLPSPSASTSTEVPVIDLSGPAYEVGAAIDVAASEFGFFQIVGHQLDPVVETAAWSSARAFFALSLDDKLAASIPPGNAYGYAPFRAERLAASLGVMTPPDLKETFSAGPFGRTGVQSADPAAAFVYSATPWPAALPSMPVAWHAYYTAMTELTARIMSLMAVGLGLADSFFEPFIDRHTAALRALHYPDLGGSAPEPGQLRAGAHTDYGTLTLLRQDDAPGGLQVRGADDQWHEVRSTPGAYVVNVGDTLARWTNDRWRSTLHRVVTPPSNIGADCTRRSLAFFHNANWDAVIECLPTCLAAGAEPKYAPVTAGRHLMDKFRKAQS